MHLLDDRFADGQTQSRALVGGLRSEEGVEDPRLDVPGNSYAVVSDLNNNVPMPVRRVVIEILDSTSGRESTASLALASRFSRTSSRENLLAVTRGRSS